MAKKAKFIWQTQSYNVPHCGEDSVRITQTTAPCDFHVLHLIHFLIISSPNFLINNTAKLASNILYRNRIVPVKMQQISNMIPNCDEIHVTSWAQSFNWKFRTVKMGIKRTKMSMVILNEVHGLEFLHFLQLFSISKICSLSYIISLCWIISYNYISFCLCFSICAYTHAPSYSWMLI